MHLCVVSPFPPEISGIGQYGWHLAHGLAATGRFRQLTVLSGRAADPAPGGLTVRAVWRRDDCWTGLRVLKAVQTLQPDVVWFNLGFSVFGAARLANFLGLAGPWLVRRAGFPVVVTLHEHYPRHLRKYQGIRDRVDRWIVTWAFQEAVRAHLGPQPCSLIHPLYPRPEAVPVGAEERRSARRRLGLPEDGLLVGYIGQIDGRKDPLAFLDFARRLSARVPATFLLAGQEEPATGRALDAAQEGLPLHRLGRLPEVGPAFAALDLYVMTSRNEGFFPLALIEALERGVPVLAPPVGGIGTVIQDGSGAFLIPKADDRRSLPGASLQAAAERMAPLLADAEGWQAQRDRAHALGTGLTRGYDAAARFREALAPWLP